MNGKTFISLPESDCYTEDNLIINVDHIIWINKKDRHILLSDGNRIYLADENLNKLESILQPI